MKRILNAVVVLLFVILLSFSGLACAGPTPAQKPSVAPSAPTATPTPAPTSTPVPKPTTVTAPTPASQTKQIVIKLVTSSTDYGKDDSHLMIREFWSRVEQKSNGALKFKWTGGPETIPTMELPQALRTGVIDAATVPASYTSGIVLEASVSGFVRMSSQDRRKSGFEKFFGELFEKKNMYYIMNLDSSGYDQNFRVFLNKPIKQPEELKGMKIRSTASYRPLLEKFGASPITMAATDLYTAVERGLVDGFVFPSVGSIFDYGLQEVTKYYVVPGFGCPERVFLINLSVWNSIPASLQQVVTGLVNEIEIEYTPKFLALGNGAIAQYQKAGLKEIKLSTEDGERLVKEFYDSGWRNVIKNSPENGQKLRELAGLAPLK